ncbi:MAG: hypothetical protein JWQ74_889 [Marmoricola sp.]|nr:hypothetical protein [Marmoricola sp.]
MSEEPSTAIPQSLAGSPPGEDSGASTAGWYEFQYGWVARHALEMTDPSNSLVWILCEWHTDFILGWADGTFCPVSVKHREPNSGRWTIATLFSDGGMLTLYERWDGLGRPAHCRWVTNGGWDTDCNKLAKACASSDTENQEAWLDSNAFRFTGASRDDVRAFLLALRLTNDSPRTKDQRVVQIDRCARPALKKLGLSDRQAASVYDAVVGIARTASQGFGGTEPTIWCSSDPTAFDAKSLAVADSANRVLRCAPICALAQSIATPAAAELPPEPESDTTLIKKLRRGDVVPTAEWAARRNRMSWTAFEATYSEPVPMDGQPSVFETLRSRVVAESADAQIAAQAGTPPYGNQMLQDVRERMRGVAAETTALGGLTPDLLMGLAYDLTARCEIWWSELFDLDAPKDDSPNTDAEVTGT